MRALSATEHIDAMSPESLPPLKSPSPQSFDHDVLANVEEKLLEQRRQELLARGEHLAVLCCGEAGAGKTTLMNSLFGQVLSYHPPGRPTLSLVESQSELAFSHTSLKIRLTVVDTPGYGDTLDLPESFERVTEYITGSFKRAMAREGRTSRPAVDNEEATIGGVDAVLYFVAPHRLKEVDLEFLRRLGPLASIIPIIAKADTYTREELRSFKDHLTRRLEAENINTVSPPFAVICADSQAEHDDSPSNGRTYPWGTAEANNDDISDLPALRRFLVTDGLMKLHEKRREFYETYRSNATSDLEKTASPIANIGKCAKAIVGFGFRTAFVTMATILAMRGGEGMGWLGKEEEPVEEPKKGWFS